MVYRVHLQCTLTHIRTLESTYSLELDSTSVSVQACTGDMKVHTILYHGTRVSPVARAAVARTPLPGSQMPQPATRQISVTSVYPVHSTVHTVILRSQRTRRS